MVLVIALVTAAGSAHASVVAFTDRAAFVTALSARSLAVAADGFESYALGDINFGRTLGAFTYLFDAALVQPRIAEDGLGGQALGGAPYDVFVGGDIISLESAGSRPLLAWGADFSYAPAFDPIPAGVYDITIDDGSAAGTSVWNAALSGDGGSFFLGLLADPTSSFTRVSLQSVVPTDADGNPTFLVPAYQIDNLIYAMPEPGTLGLLLTGLAIAAAAGHRAKAGPSAANRAFG